MAQPDITTRRPGAGVQLVPSAPPPHVTSSSELQQAFRDTAVRNHLPELAFDPEGRLPAEYGLVGIPSTLMIDGCGRILYRFLGRIDALLLRVALDRILSEGPA